MRAIARFPSVFLAAAFGVMLIGCGGGGGGGGDSWCGDASSCASVQGRWLMEVTILSDTCGESGTTRYYSNVTQSGCSLTVPLEGTDIQFSGTITGKRLCFAGSYPDLGGTLTVTGTRITLADDGLSGSGYLDWRWNSGGEACAGQNSVHLQLVE